MLECVTGRRCFGYFGYHGAAKSPQCRKCPDLFRCVKYGVDSRAYYKWLLKKGRFNG